MRQRFPKYAEQMKKPFLSAVHAVKDVTQNETHTAEPLMSEYGALDVEMTINNVKRQNYSY